MLSDITGREQVDRLPILVSGYQVEQLLGVPKLPNGTGEVISNAVLSVLTDVQKSSLNYNRRARGGGAGNVVYGPPLLK